RPGRPVARGHEILDQRSEADLDAAPPGEGEELVAYLAGAVRDGEELPRLRLQRQRDAGLLREEAALGVERPGGEDLAQRVGRRVGDEPPGIDRRGEDVAPPAAADQDLPPAVGSALKEEDAAFSRGREDRRQEP